jgi:predicted nucleic acid-binding Zn ribbon protein
MPVYVYRRGDGSSFELEQRITANALVCCPTTGQGVERVMQPFSAHYKGTGFYTTDHRKPATGDAISSPAPTGDTATQARGRAPVSAPLA